MVATDAHAHTDFAGTQGGGTHAGQVFCQCQGCAAAQKAEGLAVVLVHLHGGHAHVLVGGGDEVHAQHRGEVGLLLNDSFDFFYIHGCCVFCL